jgi:VanZ family protein
MTMNRRHRPFRIAAYGLVSAVLLWVTLSPSIAIPDPDMSDKIQHGLAWAVLTGLGLVLSSHRPRLIAAYALAFGAMVEVMQAAMGLGRQGDLLDFVADTAGVCLALAVWWLVLKWRRGRAL